MGGAAGAQTLRRRPAPGLWGDGFAGDGLAAAATMTSWDLCSPDEYAVLFPKLLPRDAVLPPALLIHLEACVAVRRRRLVRLAPASHGAALRARVEHVAVADLEPAWFVDGGAAEKVLARLGLRRTVPGRAAAEARLLAMLDGVLDQVQRGVAPRWTEDREAWFAFGSGIHPAYLWAESAISSARGCTAAWLGHLDRGRRALMPPAVAEYLMDAVVDPSRAVDRSLVAMIGSADDRERLGRAAARRLAGHDPVVAFGRNRHRRGVEADDPTSAAWPASRSFGHA